VGSWDRHQRHKHCLTEVQTCRPRPPHTEFEAVLSLLLLAGHLSPSPWHFLFKLEPVLSVSPYRIHSKLYTAYHLWQLGFSPANGRKSWIRGDRVLLVHGWHRRGRVWITKFWREILPAPSLYSLTDVSVSDCLVSPGTPASLNCTCIPNL
jgi:hypothetical protein